MSTDEWIIVCALCFALGMYACQCLHFYMDQRTRETIKKWKDQDQRYYGDAKP